MSILCIFVIESIDYLEPLVWYGMSLALFFVNLGTKNDSLMNWVICFWVVVTFLKLFFPFLGIL